MINTESTQIKQVGYIKESNTLVVLFSRGVPYKYEDVPQEVYDKLLELEEEGMSVGKYFTSEIKDTYEYSKLTWEEFEEMTGVAA